MDGAAVATNPFPGRSTRLATWPSASSTTSASPPSPKRLVRRKVRLPLRGQVRCSAVAFSLISWPPRRGARRMPKTRGRQFPLPHLCSTCLPGASCTAQPVLLVVRQGQRRYEGSSAHERRGIASRQIPSKLVPCAIVAQAEWDRQMEFHDQKQARTIYALERTVIAWRGSSRISYRRPFSAFNITPTARRVVSSPSPAFSTARRAALRRMCNCFRR